MLKRQFVALAVAIILGGCETTVLRPAPAAEIARDADQVVDDREIVAVVNSPTIAAALQREAARRGYELTRRQRLDGLDLAMIVFRTPEGIGPAAAIRELESLQPGVTAGVNHSYSIETAPDVSVFERDGPARHDASYAAQLIGWPRGGCASAASVGMIDAALDDDDPALRVETIVSRDFVREGAAKAEREHGTAVAKLLVGKGRLRGAKLHHAAVVGENARGRSMTGVDSILAALDWLAAEDVKVVNVSLAGPYNKILDRGVQRATSKGMLIVAAAGNAGAQSPPRYPAAFPDVLAVTAVDNGYDLYKNAVRGEHIDFAAPGVEVLVSVGERNRFMTGTSIAAPFVTARIASDEWASASGGAGELRRRLSAHVEDLGARGRDPLFGIGLIRASNACRPEATSLAARQ